MLTVSDSGLRRQMKMKLSSSPDARNSPDGDHLTQLTGLWCRVKSAAKSSRNTPSSLQTYQMRT